MRAERTLRNVVAPMTTPRTRRWMIAAHNALTTATARTQAGRRTVRMGPSFLIAGAQKAGTTFLYQELARHPQVRPALTKEIHYFSDEYHRGPDWYRGFFPRLQPPRTPWGPDCTGEASPDYLFHPWAAARIAADLPEARLVVLLRDPVRRAFSHYLHERRLGYEEATSFASALALEERRTEADYQRLIEHPQHVSHALRHFSYRRRGLYVDQLRRLHHHVGPDRVLVVVAEELFERTPEVYRQVVAHLGLAVWEPHTPGRNDMAALSDRLDEGSRAALTSFFRGPNEELATYLRRPLPWTS